MDLGSSGGLTWGRSGQRFVSLWGGSEGWEVGAGDAVGPAEAEAEAEATRVRGAAFVTARRPGSTVCRTW